MGHQDGHPHLRFAPAAGPRPAANQVPPGPGPSPLALPKLPTFAREFCFLRQRLQAASDIGGSGGVPRQATTWETEARSVPLLFARIVNTEGPGS